MATNEEKMALIGELAAGLAHEIKNPLAGIKGAVDILLEHSTKGDLDREALEGIRREVARIDGTVCALLRLARPKKIETSRVALSPAVLRAVRSAVTPLMDEDGALPPAISFSVDQSVEAIYLEMDECQVETALAELIGNAVEALGGSGAVSIRVGRVLENETEFARVDIKDTGRGIPREHRDLVFNPLYSTREGAAGLGLAVARRVARSHGGRVEIADSDVGGTTVSFLLPISQAARATSTCDGDGSSATMARHAKRPKKSSSDDARARAVYRERTPAKQGGRRARRAS